MMHNTTSKGFSLIEVMIALFILAVGVLGIIGLQLFAKQSNTEAIQRTAASALASDIVERMRMNKSALPSYISTQTPVPANTAIPDPDPCSNSVTPCAPAAVAARDLAIWHALISGAAAATAGGDNIGGLTHPSACVIQNPDGKDITIGQSEYRIVIAWRGTSTLANPTGDTCGNDATVTIDGVTVDAYGASNALRRVFILNAKIE